MIEFIKKLQIFLFILEFYIIETTCHKAYALPAFARRDEVSCDACHSTIPRLNRVGYEYRNSGFRFADRIGKKDSQIKEFGDLNSARLQHQISMTYTNDPSSPHAGDFTIQNIEATLYPFSGAWGKNFGSLGELSSAPGDFFEIENAYIRAVFGSEESHFNIRIGVFHPWEGFGASDKPIGLSRPLFQTTTANDASFTKGTFFTPWGFDEPGVELGYTLGGFNLTGTVLNGIFVRSEENSYKAFPFQGGNLVRPRSDPNYSAKDYQIFLNQFLGSNTAVSAYYYHGTLSLPTDSSNWTNTFNRFALYTTLPVFDSINLLAGQEFGWDNTFDITTQTAGSHFLSSGTYLEAYYYHNKYIGASIRFDFFDPSRKNSNDQILAYTASLNGSLLNGAQVLLEYRLINTQHAEDKITNNHELELRMIYVF